MSKRIPTGTTREYLESIALPNHGGRYTPISHKAIIDKVHEELTIRGFNVETELYRASISGNVANGMYILDQGSDPDMKMMFVWGNSYDKSMRFKCGVGVYIPKTDNYIFAGNLSNYSRKHTGKADEEAIAMIQSQLNMANAHYADLLQARDVLINTTGSISDYAALVGRMFIENQSINKEQACAIRDRIVTKSTFFDELNWDNAWNFYNSVATSLRISHPKMWFESQVECHKIILDYFAPVMQSSEPEQIVPVVIEERVEEPTNQLNLLDAIAEAESDEYIPMTIGDLPESEQEEIHIDSILEEKTASGEADPDEEFFNFGTQELPTFDLPDL